jgi:hypothetical protein
LPTEPPERARNPLTVTSVPGLISVFDQPARSSAFGAPISKRQVTTLPSVPFESMKSHACGLVHSSLLISP